MSLKAGKCPENPRDDALPCPPPKQGGRHEWASQRRTVDTVLYDIRLKSTKMKIGVSMFLTYFLAYCADAWCVARHAHFAAHRTLACIPAHLGGHHRELRMGGGGVANLGGGAVQTSSLCRKKTGSNAEHGGVKKNLKKALFKDAFFSRQKQTSEIQIAEGEHNFCSCAKPKLD